MYGSVVCRFEGHLEICPPGMSHPSFSVNQSILEAVRPRLKDFHQLLLEPPKVIQYFTYTIYTKVCGHPFELVDLAVAATPVAKMCVKSSTPPWNLHRQTLAAEWPY
jgi:hypothetical protein